MPLPQEKFQLHRKGESIPERSPFYMWERLSSRDPRAVDFSRLESRSHKRQKSLTSLEEGRADEAALWFDCTSDPMYAY
jgi:hypothetical protein